MKCDVCLERLEEYLDGELTERESTEIAVHLNNCAECLAESAVLVAEQEIFSRYDRELQVPASLWGQIAERTVSPVAPQVSRNGFAAGLIGLFRVPTFRFSFATALALIVIAIVISAVYQRSRRPGTNYNTAIHSQTPSSVTPQEPEKKELQQGSKPAKPLSDVVTSGRKVRTTKATVSHVSPIDQSDVLSSDFGYQDMDDRDTAKHIEQTQNLLRSIRNVQLSDGDQEIDVAYDKALSRRLLNENIVLRRDAEMKAKFPTKALLSDLEPFLIDIANLPDKAKPDDVRAIKERVQKDEIVAALIGYE
jgi:Putative zinc-finger